ILTLAGSGSSYKNAFVQAGTLQLGGGADRIPTSASVVLGSATSGGVLDLNDQNQTLIGLFDTGVAGNRVVNSGVATPTLTLNIAAGTTDQFAGILGNAGQNSFN